AAAIEKIRTIKERVDARNERELARRDPQVAATLEQARQRFGLKDDGDVLDWLRSLPLRVIQSAVAIFASLSGAGSLPPDAGLRYIAGIARNVRDDLELALYEHELIQYISGAEGITLEFLKREAASLGSIDLAPHLRAIIDKILGARIPVEQAF